MLKCSMFGEVKWASAMSKSIGALFWSFLALSKPYKTVKGQTTGCLAWDLRLRLWFFSLGSSAWDLWLWIFGFGPLAWELGLWIIGFEALAWDSWLGVFGLGSWASGFGTWDPEAGDLLLRVSGANPAG